MVFHSPEFTGQSFTPVHAVSRRARGTTQEPAFSLRTSVEGEADTSLSPWTVREKVRLLRTLWNAKDEGPCSCAGSERPWGQAGVGGGVEQNCSWSC